MSFEDRNDDDFTLIQISGIDGIKDVSIELIYKADSWKELKALEDNIKELVTSLFKRLEVTYQNGVSICLLLSDNSEIQDLNKTYRNKDKPTNVLSFPNEDLNFGDEEESLGDIVISFSTIKQEAKSLNIDIISHFIHMLAHGLLHLLGYDHQTNEQTKGMESLEEQILQDVGIILE